MFTLDVSMPEVKAAMFAQGAGDMDIWHKHIGHVNEQRLKSMQSSEIVIQVCQSSKWMECIKFVKPVNLGSKQGMHFHMIEM